MTAPTQTLPVVLQFDPAALQRAHDAAVAELGETAIVISCDAEAEIVAEYLREKVREKDAVAAMQKQALGPLALAEKTIRGWFAPTLVALAQIEAAAKRRSALRSRPRRRLLNVMISPTVAQALTVVNTPTAKQAGVSTRSFWRHVIEDYRQIPEAWTIRVPDDARLVEHAKQFSSDQTPDPIPGVRFELVTQTSVRR